MFIFLYKEQERLNILSKEGGEDLGLLLLMEQAETTDEIIEKDVFDYLDK